jgi:Zinc carboxypeptidase/Immune inhibitor A-like, MAM domain
MSRLHRPVFVVLTILTLLGAVVVPASAAPKRQDVKLQMYEAVVDAAVAAAIVDSGDYDVVATDRLADNRVRIVLVLYPSGRKALEKQGIALTLWRNDDGLTATQLASAQKAAGFKVWRPYDGPRGIAAWMHEFAAANADVAKLEVIGHTYGTNPAGGPDTPREILAIKLTGGAAAVPDGSRPAVLYSSLQHAREWISTEVNRRLLDWYVKHYRQGSQQIIDLLGTTELWFVLVANPDGYQYTFTGDRLWRKNLRDNDGDNLISPLDGVDPNRNFPEHWNYDDEGSSSLPSSETYRGPAEGSEPETKAMDGLFDRVPFAFQVNYHSFGELLLSTFGFQVNTPSADDPIYVALQGTDKHPAIPGFDPGVGADLYTTNGETTDWAHARGTLAWTPELGEGPNGDGFVFPDSEGAIQAEFNRNLPFARSVALSAADPDDPVSSVGIETEPFYLDVSEIDPQKAHNPMSDFSFDLSYGDPQPVEILAKRDIDGDGQADPVTAHWTVDGGPPQSAPTAEWTGGDRYGTEGDVYYRIMRGSVSGFDPGDHVSVWFTGGGRTSESFTFTVVDDSPAGVLVLAAEDRTGAANNPAYASASQPNYLDYYTDALTANGVAFDVYDVDARGRQAPDHLGVLSHYDAVVWYEGNDYLTREPGQAPGTGAATLANSEMLEVRAYLNDGGRLLHTGRHAGWQFFNAFDYNPVTTPPYCDGTVNESTGLECLLLSDDFYQYWLGAAMFIEDGGTGSDGEPVPIAGAGAPFSGTGWTLNGGDSADNHHENPVRGTTQSLLTTSSLLLPATYPQFTSTGPAVWDTGLVGAFEPHGGSWYAYSDRADITYKRLMRTIAVPASPNQRLSFFTSYDTELDWDFLFVEAHTPGQDDWVTLPDLGGRTSHSTGESCPEGWHELHPWLIRYQGADCSGAGWNAVSGRSPGWVPYSVDLSAWGGRDVEVSISYASDWSFQGIGVFVDDIDAPGSAADTGFESDLGGWVAAGSPPGSLVNANDWTRRTDVGYVEAAVTAMDPPDARFRTLYFGFGFEGITTQAERNDVMGRALTYLLAP